MKKAQPGVYRFRSMYFEIDGKKIIASECTGCGCRCTINGKRLPEPHRVHSCCVTATRRR